MNNLTIYPPPETMANRFTHIINPFSVTAGSKQDLVQKVTLSSLCNAHDHAQSNGIAVQLLAAVLPEDEACVQSPVTALPMLSRTVQDVRKFARHRPLPLIGDIMDLAYTHGTGEYMVYTNIDISVQPHFYTAVHNLIEERDGADLACAINRRQIGDHYTGVDQLQQMYAEKGDPHPGNDCFVFPRRYIPMMQLANTCIGSIHFDSLLAMNLDALSGFRFAWLKDLHLTFHLGEDRDWVEHIEYIEHNLHESAKAIQKLKSQHIAPINSQFQRFDTQHFHKHLKWSSRVSRRLKRVPHAARTLDWCKQQFGRTYT